MSNISLNSQISEWISPDVISKINDLSKTYSQNHPFPHISIPNFLNENKATKIKQALYEIEFQEYNCDLFHFYKSPDFKFIKDLPQILKDFHTFIFSKQAREFFKTLTSLQIHDTKVGDLHSILCQKTHYLLCHDDQVDERIIAFIVNLSEDFVEEDGGALELFNKTDDNKPNEITQQIIPKFNQLNVFNVSPISFHQINEIETEKDRISISGWYYK